MKVLVDTDKLWPAIANWVAAHAAEMAMQVTSQSPEIQEKAKAKALEAIKPIMEMIGPPPRMEKP